MVFPIRMLSHPELDNRLVSENGKPFSNALAIRTIVQDPKSLIRNGGDAHRYNDERFSGSVRSSL